jgi:hypothetical protein
MSAGSCNSLGEATQKQKDDSVANILKALGTKSCSTSADIDQFSLAAGGYVSSPIASAGFGINQSYASSLTNTDGCEQVAAVSNKFASSVKKISCLITTDSSNVNVKTLNTNTIEFIATGDFDAQDIKLDQKIGVKVVTLANLSNSTKQKIADEVQNAALATTQIAQDSKSGMGATPQGSKIVSDTQSDMTQENLTKIVNDTIKDVNVTTTSQNSILIKGRNIKLNKRFEATQEIAADIAATIILSNAMDAALDSFTKNISEVRTETKQKAENLGADTLGRQAAEGLAEMFRAQQSGIGSYSAIGAIVLLIIAVFVMFQFFGKFTGAVGGAGGGIPGGQVYARSMGLGKKLLIAFFVLCAIASGVAVWWTNYGGYDNYWNAKVQKRDAEIKKCLANDTPPEQCPASDPPGDYKNSNAYKILSWVGVVVFLIGAVYVFLSARMAMAIASPSYQQMTAPYQVVAQQTPVGSQPGFFGKLQRNLDLMSGKSVTVQQGNPYNYAQKGQITSTYANPTITNPTLQTATPTPIGESG